MTSYIGQQFGTYRLIRLLGVGGFAEVYLGEHIHLSNRFAAIKVLRAQIANEDVESFRHEARMVASLDSVHIVHVLDFDVRNGTPFLVLQYAVNGTLRERHPRGTRLEPAIVVSYVKQVAEALQYAHDRKLIHRDVKPENMLLGPKNELWLSDFGLALIAETMQSTKNPAGSYLYIAPEQIQGHPCPASDQYSLGAVVYEWLRGTPPFRGNLAELAMQHLLAPPPSLVQNAPGITPAIESVVFKALAKEPQKRYTRVQDFADDLERSCQFTRAGAPIPPPPPPVSAAAILGPAGRVLLGPMVLKIGRKPDNQLVVNDPQVSGYHAEVQPQGWGYAITDVGSANGTFVNGQPLIAKVPRLLNAGDAIRVGVTQLAYEAGLSPFEKTRRMPPQPVPPKPVILPWWRRPLGIVAVILVAVVIITSFIARNILTSPMGLTPGQAIATAGAQTATATIANQNPYPPFGGSLVINDPLSGNNRGYKWDIGTFANNGSCAFTNGTYQVGIGQNNLFACNPEAVTITNFAFQVQMTILKGKSGGIDFRQQTKPDVVYYFTIAIDGSYWLYAYVGTNQMILKQGKSSIIKTGLNQSNLIGVVAQGNTITLYVNLQQIDSTTDSTSNTGLVGLVANGFDLPSQVAFTNAKVWMLS